MKLITDIVYIFLAFFFTPVALYRRIFQNRYRQGLAHRLGLIHRKKPKQKCIWIHAVSVGEVNATRKLVAEMRKTLKNHEIVISTTTDTGYAGAKKLYGNELMVFYFPFDFSMTMHTAFRQIRPDVICLMELEVWPNLVRIANQKNVPVVVVNGRISQKSFKIYRWCRILVKGTFSRLSLVLCQSREYAERFRKIAVPADRLIVTGSMKYDTARIADKVNGTDELAGQLLVGDEPVWVAGGTGNDEEALILDVYKQLKNQQDFNNLRLMIVPRKPERFDYVANLIKQYGFATDRYSRLKNDPAARVTDKNAVVLGDTMGDLRKFYTLATVIFVGRSLVPMGGSDMAEAVALGKCTIFGPHTFNFNQTVKALLEKQGAIRVEDEQKLAMTLEKCFSEPEYAHTVAKNGRQVIRDNQGATSQSVREIANLLTSC